MKLRHCTSILLITLICLTPAGFAVAADRRSSPHQTLAYLDTGNPRHTLRHYPAVASKTPSPAIIFIHGGAWSMGHPKIADQFAHTFTDAGFHFISVGYRLVPEVAWPDNVRDVAAAVDWVYDHTDELNLDPQRITLMGHSAGAHLVACLGADPRWLTEHDRSPAELHAAVLLDGAGYEIPAVMASGEKLRLRLYQKAFTGDPAVWRDASPALNVSPDGPACPTWLSIVNANRPSSRDQSQTLFNALNATGQTTTSILPVDKTHMQVLHTLDSGEDPQAQRIIDHAKSLAPGQ